MEGEQVIIEVLINGRAVGIFQKNNKILADIRILSEKGVEFTVCSNSMQHFGLEKADIPAFVGIVASGVGELVRREHEGYAYIKP